MRGYFVVGELVAVVGEGEWCLEVRFLDVSEEDGLLAELQRGGHAGLFKSWNERNYGWRESGVWLDILFEVLNSAHTYFVSIQVFTVR